MSDDRDSIGDSVGDIPPADTQPLDVFNCPLTGLRLIEASAGTGKTWNICGLYLRLLLELRLTVQQILVVTFTNAATAELRERVRQRLLDTLAGLRAPPAAANGDPFVTTLLARLRGPLGLADDDLALQLDQALQTFDEAAIFTIHGFCQRALADTPFAARLPLVQSLLQDDSALRLEVVHDFWRQQVAGALAEPTLVAHLLARGDTPERYAQLLKRQLAKPLSRLVWPAGIDATADPSALAAAVASSFDSARALWQADGGAAHAALLAGLKCLNGTTYKKDAVAIARQGWQGLLAGGTPAASPTTLPPKLELFASGLMQARVKKDQRPPSHPFFDAAQALLDALAASDHQLGMARLRLLRTLLTDGARQLRTAKRERRVVAFDDMLFNLHERLSDDQAPGLATALKARFPAALIDEFQDTDPLQFAVFQTIYDSADADADADSAAAPAAPLFLVGDPKQAIYSFRHADLHTYLRARALATERYTLLANQRATQPLIEALNQLFGLNPRAFMQRGLPFRPVAKGTKPQAPLRDASAPRKALQLWTLPDDPYGGAPVKADASAAAAQACAGEIARLLTEAAAGRITLGDAPQQRALRAGDIAVLVRSHAQGSTMRQALSGLGVGSVELSQASVFQSPDAEELERVLAALLAPGRAGLLKAALATRCLGLTAPQINALADDESTLMAILQRMARYATAWRARGVGFMLRQWLHEEQVAERLLAAPDGARRLTNLLHLAECLHQAAAEHPSPEALLRWLQTQRESGTGDDVTQLRLESDRNLVQIVTIHKSKGLEYPVVFCPFLWDGRQRPAGDGLEGAAMHDANGDAVLDFRAGFDADFDEPAAKAEARGEAAAEFMRLVYVALTRAVHRCYLLVGNYRVKIGRNHSGNESGRSLLNWLVAGKGLTPEQWLDLKRAPAAPEAIHAAWAALGATPMPPPWRTPLAPPPGDGSRPQALPAPASLGPVWWIGSYSALVHGRSGDGRSDDGRSGDGRRGDARDDGVAPDRPDDAPPPAPGADERAASDRAVADHDLRAETGGALADAGDDGFADRAADTAPTAIADGDILAFPRGPTAGDCVHAVFEWAEFTDPATWPAAISRALALHPPDPGGNADADADTGGDPRRRHATMLHTLLANVLATPMPVGTARPLRLAQLPQDRRLAELEFHLHAPQLAAADLQRTLARLGYAMPMLGFGSLAGYLKGFVDLVFEHDGRYFIADWKSNHLGLTPAAYGQAPMAAAMAQHLYSLQSLIYCVALHRWLGQRLADYDPDRHFGGALYLFVRGVRPAWVDGNGQPSGVYFHRPTARALVQLSALLAGEVITA